MPIVQRNPMEHQVKQLKIFFLYLGFAGQIWYHTHILAILQTFKNVKTIFTVQWPYKDRILARTGQQHFSLPTSSSQNYSLYIEDTDPEEHGLFRVVTERAGVSSTIQIHGVPLWCFLLPSTFTPKLFLKENV